MKNWNKWQKDDYRLHTSTWIIGSYAHNGGNIFILSYWRYSSSFSGICHVLKMIFYSSRGTMSRKNAVSKHSLCLALLLSVNSFLCILMRFSLRMSHSFAWQFFLHFFMHFFRLLTYFRHQVKTDNLTLCQQHMNFIDDESSLKEKYPYSFSYHWVEFLTSKPTWLEYLVEVILIPSKSKKKAIFIWAKSYSILPGCLPQKPHFDPFYP